MYKQVLSPFHDSLAQSAGLAALPLVVLFVLLGVFRVRAWVASLVSLAVSLIIAVVVYPMPIDQALRAGAEGAAFGFFPILWIVLNAVWIYNMTVATGHFDVLRRSFARISDDSRIQGVIVAFSFGALLEALAGFGTPVAITSVMLIALGFRPIKAATVALVANTAPVAFGALAVPITTLATVTKIPEGALGAMVGRQTPLLGVFVPFALVFIIDGVRGLRQTFPAMLVAGVVFATAQFLISNYASIPLTDIVASLASVAATVLFLRVWRPSFVYREEREPAMAGARAGEAGAVGATAATGATGAARATGRAGAGVPEEANAPEYDNTRGTRSVRHDEPVLAPTDHDADVVDSRADIARAYAPYIVIIAVFALAQVPAIKDGLAQPTKVFHWPGLNILSASGKASTLPNFTFNWLSAAGTLLIFSGLITIPLIGISPLAAVKAYVRTYVQLAFAILTVMAVLALAYVMNASGQTVTLGTYMAEAGGLFALISPILGWLGVAVTGSDTSSNSLFGVLQTSAAAKAHLDPILLAGANSSGGVLGKMISPQNLAIASGAVGMSGEEGDLFRKVFGWSVLFVAVMCVLVYFQSTSALSWMVPGR